VRSRAARELCQHVAATSRERSGESFTRFINDVNKRIFDLVSSSDVSEKLGGIMAIGTGGVRRAAGTRIAAVLTALVLITSAVGGRCPDELIDIDGEDNTTKITRFANYLRMVLPGVDPQVSVLAARALGRRVAQAGTGPHSAPS